MDPNTYPFQQFQQRRQQQQQQAQQQQQQQTQQQQSQSPRPLQGPRPSPLRISKDSHKIKKPPTVPNNPPHAAPPQYIQPRQPVIIYAVSPKVIPASPGSFMSVVQRLTGPNSSPSAAAAAAFAASTSSSHHHQHHHQQQQLLLPSPSGAVSPAARLASIDQAERAFDSARQTAAPPPVADLDFIDSMFDGTGVELTANIMSILSPNPGTLPGIPPDIFSSSPPELNSLGFLNDLVSPVVSSGGNNNFLSPAGNFGFGQTPTAALSPVWDAFLPFPSDPPW